ncbi:hypothetical protein [Wolbachia pipientis]|nr:hypothetical protein [Wolbachia pipientis]
MNDTLKMWIGGNVLSTASDRDQAQIKQKELVEELEKLERSGGDLLHYKFDVTMFSTTAYHYTIMEFMAASTQYARVHPYLMKC